MVERQPVQAHVGLLAFHLEAIRKRCGRQTAGDEDADGFLQAARRGEDVHQCPPVGRRQLGLLGKFALGGLDGRLAVDVQDAGRRLDQPVADRMPVLVHHGDASLVVHGHHRHRAGVADPLPDHGLAIRGGDGVLDEVLDATAGLHLAVQRLPVLRLVDDFRVNDLLLGTHLSSCGAAR